MLMLVGACTGLGDGSSTSLQESVMILRLDQCLAQQKDAAQKLDAQQAVLLQQSADVSAVKGLLSEQRSAVGANDANDQACPPHSEPDDKLVVGAKENVWLPNLGLYLPARIDTGAETASLDARNITQFERDGKRWVRFDIEHPTTKEPVEVERRLERMVAIIQSNSAEAERRPVVKLGITIGHVNQSAEFTLSDRSHLDYQVLVGRNILQDVMIVDVSEKNIAPVPEPEDRS